MQYWKQQGKHQQQWDKLTKDLVPDLGGCGTVAGEAVRAANRIYYECYNNGFRNNVSGPYNYLDHLRIQYGMPGLEAVLDELHDHVNTADYTAYSGVEDEYMDQLIDRVVEWIQANPHLMAEASQDDMWALEDPDDELDEDEQELY